MNVSKVIIAQESITTSRLLVHGGESMSLNHAENGQVETVLSGEKLSVTSHIIIYNYSNTFVNHGQSLFVNFCQ